jgi:hypothetical protein
VAAHNLRSILALGQCSVCRVGQETAHALLKLRKGSHAVTRYTEPDGKPLTQPLAKKRVHVLGSF